MFYQPRNRTNEIVVVNPRHILLTSCDWPAQTNTCQIAKYIKNPSTIWTHSHSGAEEDNSGLRERYGLGRLLPGACDFYTEAPSIRRMIFVSSKNAEPFVVAGIITVGMMVLDSSLDRLVRLYQCFGWYTKLYV